MYLCSIYHSRRAFGFWFMLRLRDSSVRPALLSKSHRSPAGSTTGSQTKKEVSISWHALDTLWWLTGLAPAIFSLLLLLYSSSFLLLFYFATVFISPLDSAIILRRSSVQLSNSLPLFTFILLFFMIKICV